MLQIIGLIISRILRIDKIMRLNRQRLSDEEKSKRCVSCGKCCMIMSIDGGELTEDKEDEIRWAKLHGVIIETFTYRGKTHFYYTIPKPCNALDISEDADGQKQYRCSIYNTRPQVCVDYDGDDAPPVGITDCAWRTEPLSKSFDVGYQFVQIEKASSERA